MGKNNSLNLWQTCPYDSLIICNIAKSLRDTRDYNKAPSCQVIIESMDEFKDCRECVYFMTRDISRFGKYDIGG
jgi:hypothetical protein